MSQSVEDATRFYSIGQSFGEDLQPAFSWLPDDGGAVMIGKYEINDDQTVLEHGVSLHLNPALEIPDAMPSYALVRLGYKRRASYELTPESAVYSIQGAYAGLQAIVAKNGRGQLKTPHTLRSPAFSLSYTKEVSGIRKLPYESLSAVCGAMTIRLANYRALPEQLAPADQMAFAETHRVAALRESAQRIVTWINTVREAWYWPDPSYVRPPEEVSLPAAPEATTELSVES